MTKTVYLDFQTVYNLRTVKASPPLGSMVDDSQTASIVNGSSMTIAELDKTTFLDSSPFYTELGSKLPPSF